MNQVCNVYKDEQEKIDSRTKKEVELSLKIQDLLDDYEYDMEAVLVDGMPTVRLTERVS